MITITANPNKIPNKPVSKITAKLMVLPSAKPTNGIITELALLKKSRKLMSMLPKIKPTKKGKTAPIK